MSVIADRHCACRDRRRPAAWVTARLEDSVCFFLANKGIVGHADWSLVVEDARKVVRVRRKVRPRVPVGALTFYERPVVQALRAERPFAVPSSGVVRRVVPWTDRPPDFMALRR